MQKKIGSLLLVLTLFFLNLIVKESSALAKGKGRVIFIGEDTNGELSKLRDIILGSLYCIDRTGYYGSAVFMAESIEIQFTTITGDVDALLLTDDERKADIVVIVLDLSNLEKSNFIKWVNYALCHIEAQDYCTVGINHDMQRMYYDIWALEQRINSYDCKYSEYLNKNCRYITESYKYELRRSRCELLEILEYQEKKLRAKTFESFRYVINFETCYNTCEFKNFLAGRIYLMKDPQNKSCCCQSGNYCNIA